MTDSNLAVFATDKPSVSRRRASVPNNGPTRNGLNGPRKRVPRKRTPCYWVELVGGSVGISGAGRQSQLPIESRLRVDAAQAAISSPKLPLQWSMNIGGGNSGTVKASPVPAATMTLMPAAPPSKLVRMGTPLKHSLRQLPSSMESIPDEPSGSMEYHARLAEAAHDIKSPISVAQQIVAGVIESAQGTLPEQDLQLLNVAKNRLVEANGWAEEILVGRHLMHGTPVNIRHRFYPAQWQELVMPLLNRLAERKQVTLNWVGWDRSLPRLYLDHNHLTRIVLNLVKNAISASPVGSELFLRVDRQSILTPKLVIAIEDRGVGLSPDMMSQINRAALQPGSVTKAQVVQDHLADLHPAALGLRTTLKLIRTIGCELRVAKAEPSGTLMRLAIPTDRPESILRGWLAKSLPSSSASGRCEVVVHAIGTQDANPEYVDSQLQVCAHERDFVYRISSNRWLLFSVMPNSSEGLPRIRKAIESMNSSMHGSCSATFAYRLRNVSSASLTNRDAHQRLNSVVRVLTHKVYSLMGAGVPAIDDIASIKGNIVMRSRSGAGHRWVRQDVPEQPVVSTPRTAFVDKPDPEAPQVDCITEINNLWQTQTSAISDAHSPIF